MCTAISRNCVNFAQLKFFPKMKDVLQDVKEVNKSPAGKHPEFGNEKGPVRFVWAAESSVLPVSHEGIRLRCDRSQLSPFPS